MLKKIQISKPIIGEEEIKAVEAVLRSGQIASGSRVIELEEKFAKLCNADYAIATTNGTSALHTALHALGIKQGDEVIVPCFSFIATATCVLMAQAKPVFCDVKNDTFNIDPEDVRKKITKKTKALIPAHLFGQAADMDKLNKIAKEHNLKILEDSCQSINAELNGKKSGSLGDAGAFSFYATKNITCGEGGMLTTNDKEVAVSARNFRQHGKSRETGYEYESFGYNFRMTDVQAAILLEQLKRLEAFTEKRISNANYLIKNLKNLDFITLPKIENRYKHVFNQFTIKVDEKIRDKFVSYLNEKGVNAAVYYPKPLHLTPLFKDSVSCPVGEGLAKQVLSLPVHPLLTGEDLDYVIKAIGDFNA